MDLAGGFMVAAATGECFGFLFPLPLQDFKEGAVWGLLLSTEI